jgi:hypothetical protein
MTFPHAGHGLHIRDAQRAQVWTPGLFVYAQPRHLRCRGAAAAAADERVLALPPNRSEFQVLEL